MRKRNYWKRIQFVILLAICLAFGTGQAFAQHNHDHGVQPATKMEHQGMSHSMSMADRPIQSAIVQGLKVSLDVMDMAMHVHMQGMKGNPVPDSYDAQQSQAIMVMLQSTKSKETVKDADVVITLISPSGKEKISKAPWCGDHYGQSVSPSEKGTYKIRIKVKAKEGDGETTFDYVYKE
jgi:hypothetical protein